MYKIYLALSAIAATASAQEEFPKVTSDHWAVIIAGSN